MTVSQAMIMLLCGNCRRSNDRLALQLLNELLLDLSTGRDRSTAESFGRRFEDAKEVKEVAEGVLGSRIEGGEDLDFFVGGPTLLTRRWKKLRLGRVFSIVGLRDVSRDGGNDSEG